MPASTGLIVAALTAAAGDWLAVARRSRRAEYLLKPLTLGLLIAAAFLLRSRAPGPATRWMFTVAALVLSLLGDVFLMAPGDLFVAGLASFLLAHLAFVAAFNTSPPPLAITLGAAVVVAVAAAFVYARLAAGMARTGQRAMALPVAVYVLALGAMVVSAGATAGRPDWSAGRSALAIAGACLFFASDGLIGWTRFVGEVPFARVAIVVAYHLAQVALVLALVG